MKILIVEDDADLREITTRSLEKERYVVSQAPDYRQMIICPNLFIWPNFMHVSRACCGGISGKESRACALETLRYFPIVSG